MTSRTPLTEKIKDFKRKAWNTESDAKRYDKNLYQDQFHITIKNQVEYHFVKKYVKGKSSILDSEAVGFNPKTKKYRP